MSQKIPAGWYPDPHDTTSNPRSDRWWDGDAWTGQTRSGGGEPGPAGPADASAAPSDTVPPPPAAPPAGPAPADASSPDAASAAGGPDQAGGLGHPGDGGSPQGPKVLEGEVLSNGETVRWPELPPPMLGPDGAALRRRRKPSKILVLTAAVAVLVGLGIGSGVTYLAMHGDDRSSGVAASQNPNGRNGANGGGRFGEGGSGSGGQSGGGGQQFGEGGGGSGGSGGLPGGSGGGLPGGSGGRGGGGGGGGAAAGAPAVDVVNRITLPVPSGWTGGTTSLGNAALMVGSYTCASPGGECSLGGADSSTLSGTDVQAAAKADIAAAAKASYGDVKAHEEVKSEAVTVAGRSGYLVRWKVTAAVGNNGYVETVVFPSTVSKTSLVAVHLGFDIADKAPDPALMDTIVKGIADYSGSGAVTGGAGTTT